MRSSSARRRGHVVLVLDRAEVDQHVQGGALGGRLAEDGADRGVGHGGGVAELGGRLGQAADVERHAGDLERHVGGHLEGRLDVRGAGGLLLGGVLGHAVALDHAVVGRGVVLQELLEADPAGLGARHEVAEPLLDRGELLFADRQVADHRHERRAEGAGAGRDAAAARRRLARRGVVDVDCRGWSR